MNESEIKLTLFNWLSKALGTRHAFTITFDRDFVPSNSICGSFDGQSIISVVFTTDQLTTMRLLARAIQGTGKVWEVDITDTRKFTCYGYTPGVDVTILGPTVTGGSVQPVATVTTITHASLIPVYWEFQSAPRPGVYPYATLRLDSMRKIGWDEVRISETDPYTLMTPVGGQRVMTVMCNFFGQYPMQLAQQAFTSLGLETVKNYFSTRDLSILDRLAVTNISSPLETEFDLRASFDFYVGFADNQLDDIGIIERTVIDGTVNETRSVPPFIVGN